MARIFKVEDDKKRFIDLLLLGDEQESMIDRYLERGEMYALDDGGVKAVCVVTDEGGGVAELKNIAVLPGFRRKGCGRALIEHVKETCRGKYAVLQAGTGDSPLTVPFYLACGFVRSHTVKNFFTDNYDHPVREAGVLLKDMIYLQFML